jgi:hypothetical protein
MQVSGQFHAGGRSPRYQLDRRLGGPQKGSGRCEEEKTLTPAGNRTRAAQPVSRIYTDWAIPTLYVGLQAINRVLCKAAP